MHLNHSAFTENVFELKSADDLGTDDANEIVTKALADLTASVDERVKAVETKAADRLAKIEAKLNRPNVIRDTDASPAEVETKAFNTYLRTGDATELKTLTTTNGTTGIIVPPTLSTTILERVAERSPIRRLATSLSMTGGMLSIPRLKTDATVDTVPETGARPTTEPGFEQIDLKAFEMGAFVPMSVTSLEDANVDLGAYVANHLVRVFGDKENAWFVNGNGTTQPEGVLTSAEVGVFTSKGATIVADELVDVTYQVSSVYAASGAWLMNRKTMAEIAKLKNSQGDYLWRGPLTAGQPATLLGAPVYEAPDMPNIGAGATPIVFGDFATAYLIADRVNFEPIRDEDPRNGLVYLGGRRRVGGRVIMGEALVKLKLKA